MPLLHDLTISIDVDKILRNQGADPDVVRSRNSRLVTIAEQALTMGLPLIEPVVSYQELKIKRVEHERLVLSDGNTLSGKTVLKLLAPAKKVILMLCTVGSGLETLVSSLLSQDPMLGLALDSLGSSAVESLSVAACQYFGELGAAEGMQATIPLSPGMDGWPADRGQKQMFRILPPAEAGIQVTESGMMIPQKSLSLVIGLGPEIENAGRICDYCSVRENCRHQEKYE